MKCLYIDAESTSFNNKIYDKTEAKLLGIRFCYALSIVALKYYYHVHLHAGIDFYMWYARSSTYVDTKLNVFMYIC